MTKKVEAKKVRAWAIVRADDMAFCNRMWPIYKTRREARADRVDTDYETVVPVTITIGLGDGDEQ